MDALMFKDLIKFNKVINGCLIFGLTATPNNYKVDDAKRRIIMELKFKSSTTWLAHRTGIGFDEVVACDSFSVKSS